MHESNASLLLQDGQNHAIIHTKNTWQSPWKIFHTNDSHFSQSLTYSSFPHFFIYFCYLSRLYLCFLYYTCYLILYYFPYLLFSCEFSSYATLRWSLYIGFLLFHTPSILFNKYIRFQNCRFRILNIEVYVGQKYGRES